MHPVPLRIGLTLVGTLVALRLAGDIPGFHALIGALAGLGIAEAMLLRARIAALDAELRALRPDTPRPPASAAPPVAVQAPVVSEVTAPASASATHPPSAALSAAIRRFLGGGNALVRAGVVVLFFGVAFLLRYLAEHSHVSIEWRLTGVALGCLALLGLGWRLRTRRRGYALALQGGGVGILYLTVFAALRLYDILPVGIAFPLLAATAVLSAALAILQDSQSFALLSVLGGFLAPLLATTGEGSQVVLFSYYAVLDAGILGMAWFKAWRALNLVGFGFTFGIAALWGVLRYQPDELSTTEPFLILFFLFYFAISILFSRHPSTRFGGSIGGTLLFGTPIAAFALQSSLLHDRPMLLAYGAVALAALYIGAAGLLRRRREAAFALLTEAFLGIGVVSLTLALPLALQVRWNAASWALEGAGLIWVGCRQDRRLARLFGALLIVASGAALGSVLGPGGAHGLVFSDYAGTLAQAAAALFAARTLQTARSHLGRLEARLPDALTLWALAWWLIGGLDEIGAHVADHAASAASIYVSLTALLMSEFHRRTALASAKAAALCQVPAMLAFALQAAVGGTHPLAGYGVFAWASACVSAWVVVRRHQGPPRAALALGLHALLTTLLLALISWEAAWQLRRTLSPGAAWSTAAWAVPTALYVASLRLLVDRIRWPFGLNRDGLRSVTGSGLALYLCAWSLAADAPGSADATASVRHIPLLNALDLTQMLVLVALLRHWHWLRDEPSANLVRIDPRAPAPVIAMLAFIWLNSVLLRALHHWAGVPYDVDTLLRSTLAQTSLSIFWAVLSLLTMTVAARRLLRPAWLAGAALLIIVVVKLFLVDLSRTGSVERIVSFLGVGVLMLLVGYLSPLPPALKAR